jgi:hypothetical protein
MFTRVCVAALALAVAIPHGARAEEPKKEAKPKPPTYTVPKGWEEQEPDKLGIATARFRIGEGKGDEAVTASIVALQGDGLLVANVNRWRAQVGLKALDDEAARQALEPIKVDGRDAHFFDVTGPGAEGKAPRVMAAMIPRGEQLWVVRIGGPATKVAEQKKAFDEFVKSIRFEK